MYEPVCMWPYQYAGVITCLWGTCVFRYKIKKYPLCLYLYSVFSPRSHLIRSLHKSSPFCCLLSYHCSFYNQTHRSLLFFVAFLTPVSAEWPQTLLFLNKCRCGYHLTCWSWAIFWPLCALPLGQTTPTLDAYSSYRASLVSDTLSFNNTVTVALGLQKC